MWYSRIIAITFLLIGITCIWLYDGTVDIGDSMGHYLHAKYAFLHPYLFFDHWAKPLYVLLFAPIAQLGFEAVKVQNIVFASFTIYITFLCAKRLQMNMPWLAALFVACSPKFLVVSLSGLTEPLFAFILASALLAVLSGRSYFAAILVSFMPFVRSEGLLFIGIFAMFFAYRHQWKALPLLALGHVAYAIAGFQFHSNMLWVINKIPYASLSSPYGSGEPFHFIEQLYYITGLPIYIFFWAGVGWGIPHLFRRVEQVQAIESIVIWGGVLIFTSFHSIAWYYGMFNSMGLPRVLIGILPLVALITLRGSNYLYATTQLFFPFRIVQIGKCMILLYILLFPVIPNPASITVLYDLGMRPEQHVAQRIASKVQLRADERLIHSHPYLNEVFDRDPFDTNQVIDLSAQAILNARQGDVIIWDDWFSIVEANSSLDEVNANTSLDQIAVVEETVGDRYSKMVVFRKR